MHTSWGCCLRWLEATISVGQKSAIFSQNILAQNGPKQKIYYAMWVWGIKVTKYFFFINASKNGPYVVKSPTWAESKSDSLCILVYCLFVDWIFAIIFLQKLFKTFSWMFCKKSGAKILISLKVMKLLSRRKFSNPHPVDVYICKGTFLSLNFGVFCNL